MGLKSSINQLGLFVKQKVGVDIRIKKFTASSDPNLALVRILQHFQIDTFLDVGANIGEFAETLIKYGYRGRIISFEPTSACYQELEARSKKYSNWDLAPRVALGAKREEREIHISAESVFNSFNKVESDYSDYNADTKVVSSEIVNIVPLDDLIGDYLEDNSRVFLKIDTQGFEKQVIEGAGETLKRCLGIKMEMPLNPIYENVDWKFYDIVSFLKSGNFEPYQIYPVAINQQNGIMYEVDGVFFRSDAR